MNKSTRNIYTLHILYMLYECVSYENIFANESTACGYSYIHTYTLIGIVFTIDSRTLTGCSLNVCVVNL